MNHATRIVGNQANVASLLVTTRPEKLLDVLAYNNTAGILYIQIFESGTLPADTSVPLFSFPVQAGLGGTLGRSVDMTAISICWSSTALTKTIAAASGSIVAVLKG